MITFPYDKKLKIMVGVNTLTSIQRAAYSNHCQFWFRLGRNYPNIQFALNHPYRQSIDRMRNQTADIALSNEMDYVLFLDDDVLVNPIQESLAMLIEANADIAAGWTIIRGYPFENMFFKYTEDGKGLIKPKTTDLVIKENGLIDCDAVGFSFCLIKCSLLKKIPTPWFVTGSNFTEDVYFCNKAREHYPNTTIVVDSRIKTGHLMDPEPLHPQNAGPLREFYDDHYPEITAKEPAPINKREDDYVNEILAE